MSQSPPNEGKLSQGVLKFVLSLKCYLTAALSPFLDKDVEKEEDSKELWSGNSWSYSFPETSV